MTAQESLQFIGRIAYLRSSGLLFKVKVIDARRAWGRNDCLVVPVEGDGETWVSTDRLRFINL